MRVYTHKVVFITLGEFRKFGAIIGPCYSSSVLELNSSDKRRFELLLLQESRSMGGHVERGRRSCIAAGWSHECTWLYSQTKQMFHLSNSVDEDILAIAKREQIPFTSLQIKLASSSAMNVDHEPCTAIAVHGSILHRRTWTTPHL